MRRNFQNSCWPLREESSLLICGQNNNQTDLWMVGDAANEICKEPIDCKPKEIEI
jgi:hypothetical protein